MDIKLVTKLISELKSLTAQLKKIEQGIQQHGTSISHHDKGDQQNRHIRPFWIEPILTKYEQSIREKEAESERHYRIQKSLRNATWCAFVAASIYAGIAYFQWRDIKHNFTIDQRAWIFAIHDPIEFPLGAQIILSGQIKNTGKTPARHLNATFTTVVLARNDTPEFIYKAGTGHPTTKIESDIFFPNAPPETFQSQAFKQHTKQLEVSVMTKELADDLGSGRQFIVMHGELSYDDIFGAHHWQTFCSVYPQFLGVRKPGESLPPVAEACVKHNDIDDNH